MLTLDRRFHAEGAFIAWGKMGAGPPLLLLHGTPFSSQVWRRIAPVLAERHEVFYFDLLGYGLSQNPSAPEMSLGVQNRVLGAFLDHTGLERPTVLAHDFGGATALRAVFLDRRRFSRLILLDPVAVAPWGSPFVRHVKEHEEAFAGMPAYAFRAMLHAYIATAAAQPLSEEALGVHAAPWEGEGGQRAFFRQIASMDQRYTDEVEPHYAPPDFPVDIFWGEADPWVPLARGEALASKLTGGALTRIAGAGHLVQEDRPEAVVAAVLL